MVVNDRKFRPAYICERVYICMYVCIIVCNYTALNVASHAFIHAYIYLLFVSYYLLFMI